METPDPARTHVRLATTKAPRNLISRKKVIYPVSDALTEYLTRYERVTTQGIRYADLGRYTSSVPLYDENGRDTLWSTLLYGPNEQYEIYEQLLITYALIRSSGDFNIIKYLYVDRVDLCNYGNTLPYRVRIVNRYNENFDYFYVKRVDASRIYGLELEHLLSPFRMHYLVRGDTLIEEHIVGVPADQFIRDYMPNNKFDEIRLAKEFVKFNERCFVRLLGDMHSGNYVVNPTPDFEKMQYRMRPIDFDQQSYHWRRHVYRPQFFPQNNPIIEVGMRHMTIAAVDQYQREERALVAGRIRQSSVRFERLMHIFQQEDLAPPDHVRRLAADLAREYKDSRFEQARTMGQLVYKSLETVQRYVGASRSPHE